MHFLKLGKENDMIKRELCVGRVILNNTTQKYYNTNYTYIPFIHSHTSTPSQCIRKEYHTKENHHRIYI